MQANQQKPEDALSIVRASLSQNGQELPAAWALLALLLSAQGHFDVSFAAVSAALEHAGPQMLRPLLRIQAQLYIAVGEHPTLAFYIIIYCQWSQLSFLKASLLPLREQSRGFADPITAHGSEVRGITAG